MATGPKTSLSTCVCGTLRVPVSTTPSFPLRGSWYECRVRGPSPPPTSTATPRPPGGRRRRAVTGSVAPTSRRGPPSVPPASPRSPTALSCLSSRPPCACPSPPLTLQPASPHCTYSSLCPRLSVRPSPIPVSFSVSLSFPFYLSCPLPSLSCLTSFPPRGPSVPGFSTTVSAPSSLTPPHTFRLHCVRPSFRFFFLFPSSYLPPPSPPACLLSVYLPCSSVYPPSLRLPLSLAPPSLPPVPLLVAPFLSSIVSSPSPLGPGSFPTPSPLPVAPQSFFPPWVTPSGSVVSVPVPFSPLYPVPLPSPLSFSGLPPPLKPQSFTPSTLSLVPVSRPSVCLNGFSSSSTSSPHLWVVPFSVSLSLNLFRPPSVTPPLSPLPSPGPRAVQDGRDGGERA